MLHTRRLVGYTIGIASGATALLFAYAAHDDLVRYASLGSLERGRFWFAIGIIVVATMLSLLSFLSKIATEPSSSLTRFTIGSLVVALVCGGVIFYRSMPP